MGITILQNLLEIYLKFDYICVFTITIVIYVLVYLGLWLKQMISGVKIKKIEGAFGILLALYVALLLGLMLVGREKGHDYSMNLTLFWSYKQCIQEDNRNLLLQMIYNIIAFIPWPILFALVFPMMKKFLWGVGSAFLFSMFIEVTQLVFKLGMFEFDDMFHNTLGALIGYAILTLVRAIILKYRLQKSN